MDEQEMLDFVKALSDSDRLRIVGLLTQKPQRAAEIAAAMDLPLQQTIRHLFHLEHGGIVIRSVDGLYDLDTAGLENLVRHQFEGTRPAYLPDSTMKEDARKVLASHLNPDGSIKQIPAQAGKLKVILDYIVNVFEPEKVYTEKEVNVLLVRFNRDVAALRRYLIDARMLERKSNGTEYWRPPERTEGRPE
jgi:ArsR family transcriptional regulator, arsenate/arsenite/antimonite-responsive transcriptional repressor